MEWNLERDEPLALKTTVYLTLEMSVNRSHTKRRALKQVTTVLHLNPPRVTDRGRRREEGDDGITSEPDKKSSASRHRHYAKFQPPAPPHPIYPSKHAAASVAVQRHSAVLRDAPVVGRHFRNPLLGEILVLPHYIAQR